MKIIPEYNRPILFSFILSLLFLSGCNASSLKQEALLLILLAVVLFCISLVKTDLAIIILIFSMLLSPQFKTGGDIPGRAVVLRLDDIFLIVIFFGWLAKIAVYKELALLKNNLLNKPILIYIGISIVATLLGAMRQDINLRHGIFYLLKYIEYFILFFMVVSNLRDMKQVKTFMFLVFLVAAIVSVYAWTQIGTGVRVSVPFKGVGGEANTLAGYLLFIMGLVLGLLFYATSRKKQILLLSFLGLMFVPFLYSLSRGAWLGFFIMAAAFMIINKKSRLYLVLGIAVFLIFSARIIPKEVNERVKSTFVGGKTYSVLGKDITFDQSATARIETWQQAVIKWKDHPLLGQGIPAGTIIDNQYARILREVGLAGLVVFAWLIAMVFKVSWQVYQRNQNNNFISGLSIGFICALVGLLVQAITAETFIIVQIMEPFWFLTAIIVFLSQARLPES
ncbi:MAG: O-antigen ligase family protein [Candidatus Omnitrophica bacterium]|nr:O-antigen ligase family protein [Candidatus Omnitrophota bacterium]MDD5236450.1 O-antigen ligase family protein [Candidatus Omnitrophota bacterium]MDD5610514.1 O-antigen ligase family protein [Candidatus Omnitrophota bacterium]